MELFLLHQQSWLEGELFVTLIDLRPFLIYFGMFVAAGLGAPIPEEIAIVAAGLWTASHGVEYGAYRWLMLPVCILGVIIADVLLYTIGRLYGPRLLEYRWVQKIIPPERREKIEHNFHYYGVNILLFGRLLPGIRTPLFLTAGMMRLSLRSFFIADGLGAILGNSILFFLAFWIGDAFRDLIEAAEGRVYSLRPYIIIGVILAIAVYFLIHYLRSPVSEGDPEEVPIVGKQIAEHMHRSELRHRQITPLKQVPPPDEDPLESKDDSPP